MRKRSEIRVYKKANGEYSVKYYTLPSNPKDNFPIFKKSFSARTIDELRAIINNILEED